ncbi:ELKS/Rab6-interacting/CAST family member 1-like [Gouania willdenowi]|uniref:ELKS/Rab6-interacting/CAST family member 1-like n=1 Tax=Gouania willdenowi TaxID=441366 RepID=UPI0010565830|nr:ELKS/Rab6-interacting/CAST family member 1-like [Gouania willdenowi]
MSNNKTKDPLTDALLRRGSSFWEEENNTILQSKDKEISDLKELLDLRNNEFYDKSKQLQEYLMERERMEAQINSIFKSKDSEMYKLKKIVRTTKAQLLEKTQQLEKSPQEAQRLQSHKKDVNETKFSLEELHRDFNAQKNQLVAEKDALQCEIHQLNNQLEQQDRSFSQQQAEAKKIIRGKDCDLKKKDLLIDEHQQTITELSNTLKKLEEDFKIQTDQCTQLEMECAEALKEVEDLEEALYQTESQSQQEVTLLQTSLDKAEEKLHAQDLQREKEQSENAKMISTMMDDLAQTKNVLVDTQENADQQRAEAMKIILDKDFDLKKKDLLIDEHQRTITEISNALKKVEEDFKIQTDQCTQLVMEKAEALKEVQALEEAHCQKESQSQQQLTLLQTSLDKAKEKLHAQDLQIEKERSENAKKISSMMDDLAQMQNILVDAQANAEQQKDSHSTRTHTLKDKEKDKKEKYSKLKALWKKFKSWLKVKKPKNKQNNPASL